MQVLVIVVAIVAAGALVLWFQTQQKANQLTEERDALNADLDATTDQLQRSEQRVQAAGVQIDELDAARRELVGERDGLTTNVAALESEVGGLEAKVGGLNSEVDGLRNEIDETTTTLRKRTELADAQALQIDSLSAERDDLRTQLTSAEERIVTLAARPGVVVGEQSSDDAHAEMLWDLELARSERAWRNSVAINPVDDNSPFESAADPTRTAVEIEASALREDVGALIEIDWQATPIESASQRLLVVRVAQEMLATAARAPGAAKLVVATNGDGELTLEFESADENGSVINLIPPQISGDLIDVQQETGSSVTVKAQ